MISRKGRIGMSLVIGTILCALGRAFPQTVDERALTFINQWCDDFCTKVPLQGRSDDVDVAGRASAEIAKLLKGLASVGIEGTAKYHTSQYEGFLQKDLLTATRDRQECKFKALNLLLRTSYRPELASISCLRPFARN